MTQPVFFDEADGYQDVFEKVIDIADKVDLEYLLVRMELETDPMNVPEFEGLFI